jgi:CAAX protease family protein
VKAGRCFLQTVGVLVLFTVARALGLLGPPRYVYVSVSLLVAALILIAWRAGATRADLGLGRADMGAGVRYGAGAFGIVLLVLVVAAVIPATNGFLHDSRADIGGGRLLYELGVSIVLLTAIPEEFAFRGVLLGSALRLWGPWRASLITSALFGLWHIEPTLHTMRDNRAVAGAAASAPLMPVPRQPRNVRRPHRIRDTHPHEPPSGQPARPPGGIESLRVPARSDHQDGRR